VADAVSSAVKGSPQQLSARAMREKTMVFLKMQKYDMKANLLDIFLVQYG
jgi:hypothetical protein